MDAHKVEPFRLLLRRLEELDFAITECSEEALVAHVTHSVHGELGASLLQEDRLDVYIVALMSAAIVVYEATNLK